MAAATVKRVSLLVFIYATANLAVIPIVLLLKAHITPGAAVPFSREWALLILGVLSLSGVPALCCGMMTLCVSPPRQRITYALAMSILCLIVGMSTTWQSLLLIFPGGALALAVFQFAFVTGSIAAIHRAFFHRPAGG